MEDIIQGPEFELYPIEQELNTKSILALFETDRAQRKSFVDDIIYRMEEGEVDPLVVHLQVKGMEDIITQLTSTDKEKNKTNLEAAVKYKNNLFEAFKKNAAGQKTFGFHNAKFSQMETGVKYDFDKCSDPVWDILKVQFDEINARMKEREKFLKTVPAAGLEIRYDDELVTIYPPAKSSTTSIITSLK